MAGMAEQNGQLRKALGQREKQQQELQLELEDLRGGKEEAEERLSRCMVSLKRAEEPGMMEEEEGKPLGLAVIFFIASLLAKLLLRFT